MSIIKIVGKEKNKFWYRWAWVMPVVLAGWAAWPLFGRGFIPTHDGEYHIIRFWQFYKMLSAGYLFPRWAPDLNSGYGVPLFNFNYPFPNYIGSFFHLFGISFVDAVKLTLAAGYLTAVACCFVWLKKLFGVKGAILGAVVFAFTPYWFVDLYVRGSVGEVWAIAWFLMILVSLEYGWKRLTVVGTALMILSHNILSMLLFPPTFGYMLLRQKQAWGSVILGLGMAAYFWLPALLERGFVTGLNPVNYLDHFPDLFQILIPSWGTEFSGPGIAPNEMSFQLGLISLTIFIVALITVRRAHFREKWLVLGGVMAYGVSSFFMTEWSVRLWKLFPFLNYIQYPWRLLSITTIVTALLAGFISGKISRVGSVTLAALAIVLAFPYTKPVIYEHRSDEYYLTKQNFTDGTSSLGNSFSTIWSPWKSSRPTQRFEVAGETELTVIDEKPLHYRLIITTPKDTHLTANILYYPGWQVLVNDVQRPIDYQAKGVISFPLPPGTHNVVIRFKETLFRKTADILSLACLSWLIGSVILEITRNHAEKRKLIAD